MNRNNRIIVWWVLPFLLAAGGLYGCRDHYPHSFTIGPGVVERTHPEPAQGGYYTNWDPYAVELEVTPVKEVNPVGTQHVLIATVKDKHGKTLPNRRVEWLLVEGGVGAIIEVDESGWRDSRGHKVTNRYAISHTNNGDHVLDRGNQDPSDDVHLKRGQTWCVVTSPIEGTTHVLVYAPGIYDWSKHKVFAQKHWMDVMYELPTDATNRIETPHRLTTKVVRCSDKTPLEGYHVRYKILSGPDATLDPGAEQTTTVKTDASGIASVTLKQVRPVEGMNEIEIDIIRPQDKTWGSPVHIATGRVRKVWIAPRVGISKTAPAQALKGERFHYEITVSNPSQAQADEVVVTDELPEGIEYVSSTPPATVDENRLSWEIGTLGPGGSSAIAVHVKGERTGKFLNLAEVKAAHELFARATAETTIVEPKLAMQKMAPPEVLLRDPIPYRIVVRNVGDAPEKNLKLEDELPEGLVCEKDRTKVTADLGTLQPGESKQITFEARARKKGTYVNKAVAAGDLCTAEADAKTIVREPMLEVAKTAPEERFLGLPITYEITVTSKGDTAARDTVLVDVLPEGTTFIEASDGGKFTAGRVTWSLGDMRVGDSKKVTLTVKADRVGVLRNTATATAVFAQASAEARTTIKGIPGILLELIDLKDPIAVGDQETYQITVTNQGSAVGTNVSVVCTVPGEQEFVSATGPTKETLEDNKVIFTPLSRLLPKQAVTYQVTVKGLKAGDVRFKVSLKSDQMTTPAEETESTTIYE